MKTEQRALIERAESEKRKIGSAKQALYDIFLQMRVVKMPEAENLQRADEHLLDAYIQLNRLP